MRRELPFRPPLIFSVKFRVVSSMQSRAGMTKACCTAPGVTARFHYGAGEKKHAQLPWRANLVKLRLILPIGVGNYSSIRPDTEASPV